MTEYATIRIPKELVDQVDIFLKEQNLGFTSRAEIVKVAIRGFLDKTTLQPSQALMKHDQG